MAPSKAPAATWSKTGITGARWGIDTAEAILQLRALHANGDFDEYWNWHRRREHQRTYQANHALAA